MMILIMRLIPVATALAGLLLTSAAAAKIRTGLYKGKDKDGKPCTLEVRGIDRRSASEGGPVVSVIVSPMRVKEILDIAPVTAKGDDPGKPSLPDLNMYAGYRGDEDKHEVVRLDLDDDGNPKTYAYFNNTGDSANAGNLPDILVKCTELKWVANPDADDVTVDP